MTGARRELQVELIRKTIHLMIAVVPFFAALNVSFTMSLLGAGTIMYTYSELRRLSGRPVLIVSRITLLASRPRDAGGIVMGPITLAMGAMLALLLYPGPAATIAIYALAFGDGLSSLVGKMYGRVRIPLTGGKTYVGSLTCFLAVLAASYGVTGDAQASVMIALAATLLEALPVKDLDNILLPVGTGFAAQQIISVLPL